MSLMVRFLGASCYSGQWIFDLSLFLGPALGLLCVRVSLWGSRGAARLLVSFSGLLWATGHGGWKAWVFLLGAEAFGVWGLGLWLFLSASE